MCGICGVYASGSGDQVSRPLLERMNTTLHHRGPDSQGVYIDGNFGMAMRRLSIIDVAGGDQPIANEDGSVVVVYNGEIYNFGELRGQLQKLGHRFATRSDTEVIVHAYEQWGDEALLRFNGMFAFSLWDRGKQRLLLARDRMGKKPLYWHFSPRGLLWASEIKALLAAPWVERKIDNLALHHYLTLQYVPDPLTIFAGLYQVPAAHKLVVEAGAGPQVSPWWQLAFEPKWELSDVEAVEQARTILSAAVKRRLISEVPLGAFLSGGIDSSIVVALMAENSTGPVKTFSIGFEEAQYSEARFACQVAERYQTDHHEFIFRPADLVALIEAVIAAFDQPFADPAALPLYELAIQTRRYVTVALSGDGGDETLAGYQRYVLDGLLSPYTRLPAWFTQRLVPALVGVLPEPGWAPEDRNPLTGLKRLGQFSAVTQKASLVRWGSYFNHQQKLALYSADLYNELKDTDTADWIAAAYDRATASSLLDRTLHADHVTYLSGDLLPKTDRVTMAHSLEARAPLLDAEWVEWSARLPRRHKVRGFQTKWLLRKAFADKLPGAILARGKQGFSIPIGPWLQNQLRSWAYEHLGENSALVEYFRPSEIQRLFEEHQAGKANHGKKLWALLMFALWMDHYL
ncbi:MAG: asparagine synthase (glutamine-hydrolyzing) [Anaerolineales bacterium]|nr:asparagine synthase (glutamine-hydrolyzing) [Anaerolineales bacterium]